MSCTLIIGSNGSMGRRYQAILRALKKPFVCFDVESDMDAVVKKAQYCDGIIIASPTDTHFNYLVNLQSLGKNILCEKPLTKSPTEMDYLKNGLGKTKLKMVMQYKILDTRAKCSPSHYDYFRTGNDGLYWDCIQIIGLARGPVKINNESPVWRCGLNGRRLNISQMDHAYIKMVKDWFNHPDDDMGFLSDIHHKTREMSENGSH